MSDVEPHSMEAPPRASLEAEAGLALLATTLAALAALAAERLLGFAEPSLLFMTAVILVSARVRMPVVVATAVMSLLTYDFLFIEPRHTFAIGDSRGWIAAVSLLLAAVVCGRLAARLHAQVRLLEEGQARARLQREFGHALAGSADEDAALRAAGDFLHRRLDAEVHVLGLGESGQLRGEGTAIHGRHDPALKAALARYLAPGAANAADADALSWHCLPVRLAGPPLAVACLRFPQALPTLEPERARLLEDLLHELAQTLARLRLAHAVERERLQVEGERLRSALLSSVSHDLRSPLSTIIGSAESLCLFDASLAVEDRRALARDIHGEGLRLERYIQNLLDMTRVGEGTLALAREWVAVDELCGSLLARLARAHPCLQVKLSLPLPKPWLQANPGLLEQALYNVLDNAARFSPADAPVELRIEREPPWLRIDVLDRGPGIAASERGRVFDRFYSVGEGGGAGLGLAICRGIVLAHGGQVEALPREDGAGACLRLRLPLVAPPADEPAEDAP